PLAPPPENSSRACAAETAQPHAHQPADALTARGQTQNDTDDEQLLGGYPRAVRYLLLVSAGDEWREEEQANEGESDWVHTLHNEHAQATTKLGEEVNQLRREILVRKAAMRPILINQLEEQRGKARPGQSAPPQDHVKSASYLIGPSDVLALDPVRLPEKF